MEPRDFGIGRLFEHISDAVIVADTTTGRIVLWNRGAAALFGYSAAEARDLPVDALIPEQLRAAHWSGMERYRATGQGKYIDAHTVLDLPAVRRDGAEIRIEMTLSALADLEDERHFVLAIVRDITARTRVDQALRESEERFRMLFEHSPDAIFLMDPADANIPWRIVACNEAAGRMNGYRRDELIGRSVHILNPGGDRWIDDRSFLERLRAAGAIHGETPHQRKDGTIFTIEFSTTLVSLDGRELALGIDRDISERKQAEAARFELERARLEVEERARHAEALRVHARQQAAVAELGQQALGSTDLPALLDEAVGIIARTLEAEYSAALELQPDGKTLRMIAGVGWQPGIVGHLILGSGRESLSGYTLLAKEPLIIEDLNFETRFRVVPLLHAHGIVSGMSVIIHGMERPFGVVNTFTTLRRTFSPDDINFVQAISNVLAMAINRTRIEDERSRLLLREQHARSLAEAHQRRLAFLTEASKILGASLDYETTLGSLVSLAVPRIADWCSVNLVDEDGALVRIAGKHVDPAKEALLNDVRQRFPPELPEPDGAPAQEATTGALLIPEVTDATLLRMARHPEQLEVYRTMGFRSAMVVPLHGAEGQLGVMLLASGESGRRYNDEDLGLAEELVSRAAMAIDNARLYRVVQAGVRLRDEFLSIAAHELRTPTTSLLAYAQLLQRRMQREGTGSQRDQRAVTVIAEQADRLSQLINSLLDLSRIEMGRLALACRPIELVGLLQRLVEDLRPSLQTHTLHIDSEVETLVVQGDEVRLEQVFQNLLGNAIKYSPAGGPVGVRIWREEDQAIVSITDRGMGIPANALPQLFQRFYRAGNVLGTDISGFGIGLFVVQEVVSRHDGSVEVASVEGEGSTFMVRLPVGDRG